MHSMGNKYINVIYIAYQSGRLLIMRKINIGRQIIEIKLKYILKMVLI